MSKQLIHCTFLEGSTCSLIKKISRDRYLDATVTIDHCKLCNVCEPKRNVNRFTVCEALSRIKDSGKFDEDLHSELIHCVQCTLGAGSMLHEKIHWFKTVNCGCEHKVHIMNVWGPYECENNFQDIITWLEEASIFMKIPFVKREMEKLVRRCIARSKMLHTEYRMEWIYNV